MYYQKLIGQKIGKWQVLSLATHGSNKHTKMYCRCDCGALKAVDAYSLKHELTLSCGHCKKIIKENDYMRCINSDGTSFIFDDIDLEIVKQHCWRLARGHVHTCVGGKSVYLHRLIMNAPENTQIDHINGVKTDNRRSNLRFATHAENQRNRGPHKGNKTGYKGVCIDRDGKYFAYINCNGKRTYLGRFSTGYQAAKAYDAAALILHGEFAKTNL